MLRVLITLQRATTGTILSEIAMPDDLISSDSTYDADAWVYDNFPGFTIAAVQVIVLSSNHGQY